MINTFLFIGFIFLFTFLIGRLIEKIKIPWIFSSLLLGFFLAIFNPFVDITSSSTFKFLAELGIYFLLFIIGFEINLKEIKRNSRFIFKLLLAVILLETLTCGLIVRLIFGYDWFISFLVALSFATVGEAILVPILDEFKLMKTQFGQYIVGVGTIDDIIEVIALLFAILLIGSNIQTNFNTNLVILSIFILFILTFGFTKFKKEGRKFSFLSIETLFLFVLFIFFLFLGIGEYANAAPLSALMAGVSLKTFIQEKRLKLIENELRAICYGFFAPLFFLWVGMSMDINYLITFPVLVIILVAVSSGSKLLSSYCLGKNKLGKKQSILLGIGLSVRFSTSIIIVKILLDNGLIGTSLYSVIVASSMILTFTIPFLFSCLIKRYGLLNLK